MKKLTKIIAMLLCIVVLTSTLTSCDQMLETILDRLFPSADPQPEEEEKHTHTWGDWEISTVPDCETAGERERLCSGCGEIKSETISATGHDIYEDDDRCRSCDKPRLAAPQNVSINGDKISWDRVSNAESYTVTVNGDYTLITKNRFAYVRDAKDEQGKSISTYGEIIVTVRADSVKNYIYSKMSEEALSYYVPTKEDDDNLASLGIGRSYNLIENDVYNIEKLSQNSVLDINKLLGLGNYTKTDNVKAEFDSYSYSSNVDKFSQAEVNIGFGAEINYGIGNVKAEVSGSAEQDIATHSYNHVYAVNGTAKSKIHMISDVNNAEILKMCLSNSFKNDVDSVKRGEMTVEQLYSKYGTHAILGVVTGGSYNVQYVVSTDSKTLSEEIATKFGVSTVNKIGDIVNLNLNFDVNENNDLSEEWKNVKINLSISYSGSTGAIAIDVSDLGESVNDFKEGVKTNAIPFAIPENGTIPLIDLIKSMGEEYYDVANTFADCLTKKCIAAFVEEMKRQQDEYRFDGLFTAKEGGEKIVDENGVILVDISSINVDTLYPHWTRVKIDVLLNADGGKIGTDVKTLDVGSDYGDLPIPTKIGYAFVGWYTEVDGTGKKVSNHDGKTHNIQAGNDDITLYAYWIPTSSRVTSVNQIRLESQQTHSKKSSVFSLGLDLEELKNIGYTKLIISISGSCSEYDWHMNERGRYLILSDATSETDIVIWNFHVKNFSGVEEQTISINSINNAGLCQLQLISDKSDAYNEKLTVSNLVITVIAIK